MKRIFEILILTILAVDVFGQDSGKLYPITDNGLYGYIDKTGKTVIEPQFLAAGQFSEGLAAVRLNGTYGYIDLKGKFVILPKFDFALPFENGLAKVIIDGKSYFIDKKGVIAFNHNYEFILGFDGYALATVVTQTGKYGLINKSGNLVFDTAFAKISAFENGVAVVTGLNHNPHLKKGVGKVTYEKGVIDTLGNWLVKYGEYKDIRNFINGYALVELMVNEQKGQYDHEGMIDKTGKYRFTIPSKKWKFAYTNGRFFQDIAIVEIYVDDTDTTKASSSARRSVCKGAVNAYGEIILSNKEWDDLTPFSMNRAFAKSESGRWYLIDISGQTVTSQSFDEVLRKTVYGTNTGEIGALFQDGIAFVKTEKGWAGIDTMGVTVFGPRDFQDKGYESFVRNKNVIFFCKNYSTEPYGYDYRYGFWNAADNIVIEPRFDYIDKLTWGNGLIHVVEGGKNQYINASAKEVWRDTGNKRYRRMLNIDYMQEGYCYASSCDDAPPQDLESSEASTAIGPKQMSTYMNFSPDSLQVFIDTTQRTTWKKKYDAFKMFVANASRDTLFFNAQDGRLYLKIQAQDRNGFWKDIEYLPSSWCGNSYHTLFLAPNQTWEFPTPIFQGEFKTKIRAELLYVKKKREGFWDRGIVLYSNEINGYINPGQFWNKKEYFQGQAYDPYMMTHND